MPAQPARGCAGSRPAGNQVRFRSGFAPTYLHYFRGDAAMFFKISKKTSRPVNFRKSFNESYIVSADANDNLTPEQHVGCRFNHL
jgi:hypothetical protein